MRLYGLGGICRGFASRAKPGAPLTDSSESGRDSQMTERGPTFRRTDCAACSGTPAWLDESLAPLRAIGFSRVIHFPMPGGGIAELAIDKQAQTLLMPVSARRQLNDLPDDPWTRISIEFYKDAADAVFKALVE